MVVAQSKVTAQGQISIPTDVRKILGVGPGSVIEWEREGETIVVRRAAKYTSEDVHRVLFPEGAPKRRSLKELKQGIAGYIKKSHARGRY